MTMPVVVFDPLSVAAWDDFVARRPDALLFHTSQWLALLEQVYSCRVHLLGVWDGGALVGLLPLLTRRLGPFLLGGSPLMQAIASTPFMGPLADPVYRRPILRALGEWQRKQKIAHLELALPVHLADVTDAIAFGYSVESCQSVVLALEGHSRDELWGNLSSACRRAVHKAEAQGVQIVAVEDATYTDVYYPMCAAVYQTSGRLPHLSKAFYAAAWDLLAAPGYLKVWLAVTGGDVIAGAVVLRYRGTAYYLSGASYDEGQPLRPNNLLQWHIIQWAAAQGCAQYDLGGAVISGITRFKLSFGGELHSYTRLHRASSQVARLGRCVYAISIPLWRRFMRQVQGGLR